MFVIVTNEFFKKKRSINLQFKLLQVRKEKDMSEQNFDETLRQYNLAMSEFFKGNPEPINSMYSKSDEISLAQLSGPFVIGRNQVTSTAINNVT